MQKTVDLEKSFSGEIEKFKEKKSIGEEIEGAQAHFSRSLL